MKRFLLILIGIISISIGSLYAGNSSYYFANVEVQLVPSGAGTAYAVADNIYDQDYQNYGYSTSSGGNVSFKLYHSTSSDEYTFLGWSADNNIANIITNSNTSPFSQTVKASTSSANSSNMLLNSKEYTYYGFYAKLASSGVADFTACDASQVVTISHQNASTLTIAITGTHASMFSVSQNTISSTTTEQATPITITYTPSGSVPSGGHVAQLSITSSNTKISGLSLNLKGDLCDQQIFWSIGDVLTKDQLVTNVATSSSGLPVKLSLKNSSDASYISIGSDENSLTGIAVASSVTIVATAEGDSEYKTVTAEKTITITDLATQYIGWEQSFSRLVTGPTEQRIELNAATYDVETGTPTNGIISYSLSDVSAANLVRIEESGGKSYLVVNNSGITGSADITASSPSTSTYYQVSLTLKIIVRQEGACNVYLYNNASETTLYSRTGYSSWGWNWNDATTNALNITNVLAPYTTLSFKAKGTQEGSIGVLGYQSVDCTGASALVKSFTYGDSEFQFNNTKWTELTITFPNNTYKSFSIQATSGEDKHENKSIAIKDIVIMQSSYFTTNMPATQAFEANVNSSNTLSYKVNYSARNGIIVAKGTASGANTDIAKYVNIVSPVADGTGVHDMQVQCADFGSQDVVLDINSSVLGTCTIPVIISHGSGTDASTYTMNLVVTIKAGETYVFDNNTGDGKWETLGNWKMKTNNIRATKHPNDQNPVEIAAPATLNTIRGVYQLSMISGGSLSIGSAAGLSVGSGGVSGTNTSNLILEAGDNSYASTGFLRVYPTNPRPTINASVNMYSISYYNADNAVEDAYWQYVGSPVTSSGPVENIFYQCWLYSWNAGTWNICRNGDTMAAFKGYALTQSASSTGAAYAFAGTLITDNQNISLVTGSDDYANFNSLANSYAAPIDITKFTDADFVNCEHTIYLYHTGSYNQWDASSSAEGTNAGQYSALPIGSAGALASKQHIIPAMQGFFVEATGAGASLHLDYERLVWNAELNKYPNQPLRAPQSTKMIDPVALQTQDALDRLEISERIEMTIVGDGREDYLALLQSDLFTAGYDESYDAEKMFGEDFCPAVYTNGTDGRMEVCATNDLVGTYIGFNAPNLGKDTILTYTIYFQNTLQGDYVLRDLVANKEVVMKHGNSYTFQVAAGEQNDIRFIIGETQNIDGPTTSLDNSETTINIWQCGERLYASCTSYTQQTMCLFDMQGKMLSSSDFVGSLMYDLSMLPQGAYLVRIADQTLKIVR